MTDSRNLDFLRSVAVLLVLFDHLFMAAGLADRYPFVWSMGHLGVLMFFVHTSLVLMLSLERSEEKSSGHLFRDFYIRRAFRIYPLSIACVVLVSAFAGREFVLRAYRHAAESGYRFYSYGDCMWIR